MLNTAWMVVAVAVAAAQARTPQAEPMVRVVVRDTQNTPSVVLGLAQYVAGKEFAAIGVPIKFESASGSVPEDAGMTTVEVVIVANAPATASAGALAVATPYSNSGTRITVFYNRVAGISRLPVARVLGYVLAHEIGHVLQRVARHSDEGVMKARWKGQDFGRMGCGKLHFTVLDAALIRDGMQKTAATF